MPALDLTTSLRGNFRPTHPTTRNGPSPPRPPPQGRTHTKDGSDQDAAAATSKRVKNPLGVNMRETSIQATQNLSTQDGCFIYHRKKMKDLNKN